MKNLLNVLLILLLCAPASILAEGSAQWMGSETGRVTNLFVPSTGTGANVGYHLRGFMMLPTNLSGNTTYNNAYNPGHRLYVYVKSGETVYWGFHTTNGQTFTGNAPISATATWYYDATSSGFYPVGKSGTARTNHSSGTFGNSNSSTAGIVHNQTVAAQGPSALCSSGGYNARSFTNSTGADRAFWVEVSSSNSNFEIDWWDITVATGTGTSATIYPGRVYCKYWSIANGLPSVVGATNSSAFHDGFGFYVPIENKITPATDYFIKYLGFPKSNGGLSVFFSNDEGPGTTGTYIEKRKSIDGARSVSFENALFVSNPDIAFWPSTYAPNISVSAVFSSRSGGGEANFSITVDGPCTVDLLIDLNNNGFYDNNDVILSANYATAGTYTIYWNGNNSLGNPVASNSTIEITGRAQYFPVHFPVYDLEQNLGMIAKNIRPGVEEDELLFWDFSALSTANKNYLTGAGVVLTNTIGRIASDFRWNGVNSSSWNAGPGNDNTMNAWTAGSITSYEQTLLFDWTSADLKVEITPSTLTPIIGETITFTITATNLGIGTSLAEVITLLPAGYTLITTGVDAPSATVGTYIPATGKWTVGINDMVSSQVETLTLKAVVTGTVDNVVNATISSANGVNDPDNK